MKRVRVRSGRAARARTEDRGALAVEFALVAVLLFMLLFAIIVFARYMWLQQAISAASREAARFGIATGHAEHLAEYPNCDAIRDRAQDFTGDIGLSDDDIAVMFTATDGSVADCEAADVRDGDRITVTVTTPMDVSLPLVGGVFDGAILSATDHRTVIMGGG